MPRINPGGFDTLPRSPNRLDDHLMDYQGTQERHDRSQAASRCQDVLRRAKQAVPGLPPLTGDKDIPKPLPLVLPDPAAHKEAV
jgi:hypothetical protein